MLNGPHTPHTLLALLTCHRRKEPSCSSHSKSESATSGCNPCHLNVNWGYEHIVVMLTGRKDIFMISFISLVTHKVVKDVNFTYLWYACSWCTDSDMVVHTYNVSYHFIPYWLNFLSRFRYVHKQVQHPYIRSTKNQWSSHVYSSMWWNEACQKYQATWL